MEPRVNVYSELRAAKKGGATRWGEKRAKRITNKFTRVAKEKARFQKAADEQLAAGVKRSETERNTVADAAASKNADKAKRAAATRRKNAEHKTRLARMSEIEDLRTSKQVERVKAVSEARAATKPKSQKKPVAKPAVMQRPTNVGKDNLLKPTASKSKRAPKANTRTNPVRLNTAAAEAYRD